MMMRIQRSNVRGLLVAAALAAAWCSAASQPAGDAKQRFGKLVQHGLSMHVLRYELGQDPKCSGRRFPELDTSQFADAIPAALLTGGQAERDRVRQGMAEMSLKSRQNVFADGRRAGTVAYEQMIPAVLAERDPAGRGDRCAIINDAIQSGYQRVLSEVRELR